jgi:hypothetical protein
LSVNRPLSSQCQRHRQVTYAVDNYEPAGSFMVHVTSAVPALARDFAVQ